MTVIKTDAFDKSQTVRIFQKLTGLLDEHYADVLDDPIKHLKHASELMFSLNQKMREIEEAAYPRLKIIDFGSVAAPPTFETVVVKKEDWECLCAVRELIKNK